MVTKEKLVELEALKIQIDLKTGMRTITWRGGGAKDSSTKNLATLSEESRLAYFTQLVNDINHSGAVTTLEELDKEIMDYQKELENDVTI